MPWPADRGHAGRRGPWSLGRLLLLLLAAGPSAAAQAERATPVEILAVEPACLDTLLACTLRISGLPDAPSRETISSGLPSALVVAFEVEDDAGETLLETRIPIRIEPDWLTEAFVVRTPFIELRAETLSELSDLLAHLGPMPVAPLRRIDPRQVIRVQSRLAIHPLAPAEIERVHALFGGDRDGGRENRQELSIGIGTLVRRLLGNEPDEDWIAAETSRAFRADTLGGEP